MVFKSQTIRIIVLIAIVIILATIIAIAITPSMISMRAQYAYVPTGYVGLLEKNGIVEEYIYPPGAYQIDTPWSKKMNLVNMQVQKDEFVVSTATSDGHEINMSVTVVHQLEQNESSILSVYEKFKSGDYLNLFVKPEITTILKTKVSEHTYEEIQDPRGNTFLSYYLERALIEELQNRGINTVVIHALYVEY